MPRVHSLQSARAPKLAAEEIRLIESMTDQLGVAIDNISLFEELKEKSAQLQTANISLARLININRNSWRM